MPTAAARITLYHGPCEAVLPTLPDASQDVLFLDPPYNTGLRADKTVRYTRNADFAAKGWVNFHASWDTFDDYGAWCRGWLREGRRLLTPGGSIFVCCSYHNLFDVGLALRDTGFWIVQDIAWCISNAMPHLRGRQMANSHQTILWARRGKTTAHRYNYQAVKAANGGKNLRDYWEIPNDTVTGRTYKHPSKKNPLLIQRALRMTCPMDGGARVLDCFAGVGSTGAACNLLAAEWGVPIHSTLIERSDTDAEPYVRQTEQRLGVTRSAWEQPHGG